MKNTLFPALLFASLLANAHFSNAQWMQTSTTGPSDYNNSANWQNGDINGEFTSAIQDGLNVTFAADTALGSGTSLEITNDKNPGNIVFSGTGGDRLLTLNGTIKTSKNSGSRTFTFGSTTSGEKLNLDLANDDRTFQVTSGDTVLLLNNVSSLGGDFGVIKKSSGTLILANTANSYTGQTAAQQGTLVFSHLGNIGEASSFGTTDAAHSVIALGASSGSSVTLQFGGGGVNVGADSISNRAIQFTGNQKTYTLYNESARKLMLTADFQNAAVGTTAQTLAISGSNGSATEISGVIGDVASGLATSLTANGQNGSPGSGNIFTLRITGTANTFSGAVGTGYNTKLAVVKLADIGQTSSLGTGAGDATITVGGKGATYGSTLSYIGNTNASTNRPINLEFRSYSTNTISNDSANNSDLTFSDSGAWSAITGTRTGKNALALEGSSAGTSSIAGQIQDALDSGGGYNELSLSVNSAGIWRLENSGNSYTGTTTVTRGTLQVDGSIASSSLTTIQSGAKLQGTGTLGNVTVENGGTLAAGSATALSTSLTVNDLTLSSDATLFLKLDSVTGLSDTINVNGGLSLDNVTLVLRDLASSSNLLAAGTELKLFKYTGTETGEFVYDGNVVANGDLIHFGSNTFQVDYAHGDPSVVLIAQQAIPEPSAWLLLVLGGIVLFFSISRYSKKSLRS